MERSDIYKRLERAATGPDAEKALWRLVLELRLKKFSCIEIVDIFEPAFEWLPDEAIGYSEQIIKTLRGQYERQLF